MTSHDISSVNKCPTCNKVILVKRARGGASPGSWYIRCVPCVYHYRFPRGVTPAWAHTSTPSLVSPLSGSVSSLGPTTSRKPYLPCLGSGCNRHRHRFCSLSRCRTCCGMDHLTKCDISDHQHVKDSVAASMMLSKGAPSLAASPPRPSSPKGTWDSLLTTLADKDTTLAFFRQLNAQAEATQRVDQLELEREAREDAALDAAIAASRITYQEEARHRSTERFFEELDVPVASSSSSSHSRRLSPLSSSSRLRSLSPDFEIISCRPSKRRHSSPSSDIEITGPFPSFKKARVLDNN